jgi:hypothetical protein
VIENMERETGLEPACPAWEAGIRHPSTVALVKAEYHEQGKEQRRIMKSLEELRQSPYHQQLGRKLCAAFIAQQQGVRLDTAYKKAPDSVADLWLVVAEFTRRTWAESIDSNLGEFVKHRAASIM